MLTFPIFPSCFLIASAFLATIQGDAENRVQSVEDQVTAIERSYDLAEAKRLLPALQTQLRTENGDEGLRLLVARTALVAAMLHRKDYEEAATDYAARRELGRKIDDVATAGLGALKDAAESSERFRLEADLWGTMMRTQARGSQFRTHLETATEKALELGPDNANAYITASKRKIFASERRGGDIEEALRLLDTALELDPASELALVFRGLAYEKRGDIQEAQRDWRKALDLNPASMPAQENLDRVEAGKPAPYEEH